MPFPPFIFDDSDGLPTNTDPPIFEINYRRLAKTCKKLSEKKVLALIKEAYLTGRIDPYIKRVLIRLPVAEKRKAVTP